MGVRATSSGNGKNRGGHGAVVGVQIYERAEFKWIEPMLGKRLEGSDLGRAGQPCNMEIMRALGGTRENLVGAEGSVQLECGDQIFVMTAGGGGFGEPIEPETTE